MEEILPPLEEAVRLSPLTALSHRLPWPTHEGVGQGKRSVQLQQKIQYSE
jgi:hypothetical protein